MAYIVADCPRCGAKTMTFDVKKSHFLTNRYGWKAYFEVFCICRSCFRSTTFYLAQKQNNRDYTDINIANYDSTLNNLFSIEGYVSLKDYSATPPPKHLPEEVNSIFQEATTCMAVQCFNASGAMFRLCIDLATKHQLPDGEVEGLNRQVRGKLAARLDWLFDTKRLAPELKELAQCIRNDGNDGAHDGTLSKEDSEDLLDFTYELLKRIYTEPERIRIAQERREQRRQG